MKNFFHYKPTKNLDFLFQARALLEEKQVHFERTGEALLTSKIPAADIEEIIKKRLAAGSDFNYIEEYCAAPLEKRADLVPPPFNDDNEGLQYIFVSNIGKTKQEKIEAYTRFYVEQYKKKKVGEVIRLSYRFNPQLKKPGGERNQMATDLTEKLICLHEHYGALKQYHYLQTTFDAAVSSAESSIADMKNKGGETVDERDVELAYLNLKDVIDLRMIHFLATPEHTSVWKICVAMKGIEGLLRNNPALVAVADRVRAFVDEQFSIKASTFAEQQNILEEFIRDVSDSLESVAGLEGNYKIELLRALAKILVESDIPRDEVRQRDLFILSRVRQALVEYHAINGKKVRDGGEGSASIQAYTLRNHETKMTFIECAIESLDSLGLTLRTGDRQSISQRNPEMNACHKKVSEVESLQEFLLVCSQHLSHFSSLPKQLNETFELAQMEWFLMNLLLKHAGWKALASIELLIAAVMSYPLAQLKAYMPGPEASDLNQMIGLNQFLISTNSTQNNKQHQAFLRDVQMSCLFGLYQGLLEQSLDLPAKSQTIDNLTLMVQVLDFMLPYVRDGESAASRLAVAKQLCQKIQAAKEAAKDVPAPLSEELTRIHYRLNQPAQIAPEDGPLDETYYNAFAERLAALRAAIPASSSSASAHPKKE